MLRSLPPWISPAIAPLAALLALLLCLPLTSALNLSYWQIFQQLPYVLAGVLITLAQMFNQGRLANVALLQACSYALIQTYLQVNLEASERYEMYYWLSLILPLNLVIIRLLPNRRPLSLPGTTYPLMLLLQGVLLSQLPALLEPFTALQNLWATDIVWQAATPPTIQSLLEHGHLGLLPLASLSLSIVVLAACSRAPWTNDLALITLALMAGVMFYYFATPRISILVNSLAMLLLFASLLINNHRLAFIDELTGLPARRALMNDLEHRWGRYCLVMADVDHFKQFNDTHGHDVGDDVLRAVAQQLGKAQGRGKAYRYGGEEFTLVFPVADDVRCQAHVEELRERIAAYRLAVRNPHNRPDSHEKGQQQRGKQSAAQHLQVTMSFGLAQRRRGETIDALLKRADNALYEAKKRGRNRVQLAER